LLALVVAAAFGVLVFAVTTLDDATKPLADLLMDRAMEALLKKAVTDGKVKGFKPHVTAFLGYILAHESQHRGQIALSLKQSGHALVKKISYGIWEWGVR